ncbi:MAG: hypothetical protein M1835_001610 [Candelina submexicana]|nr:MAG: hypothetical protein M1835_001610 [Candelina submexicana]
MAPQVLYRVCYGTSTPSPHQTTHLTIRPALLPNYSRRQVRFHDYPAITPTTARSSVRGAYVTGLTEGDLWRLDIFEGEEYERRVVRVQLLDRIRDGDGGGGKEGGGEGEEVEAETYVWVQGEEGLEGGEWDFEVFKREKMKRWVEEEDVDEVDAAVSAQSKDPTGGRGLNGDISNQLNGARGVEKLLESAV